MKQQLRKTGAKVATLAKKYAPTALFMLVAVGARAAAGDDAQTMFEEEIMPLINTVLNIAITIATLWCAITFFTGKKTAFNIGGFILLGAVIFRLLPGILEAIVAGGKK
jgi:uncharacterized membrane protein YgdD (TMEM256/DUF423 family)